MNSISNIIEIFSQNYKCIKEKCKEDFYSLFLFYTCNDLKDILPRDGIETSVSVRDVLSISIYDSEEDDSEIAVEYLENSTRWIDFIEEYTNIEKSCSRIITIKISKKKIDNQLSVYNPLLLNSYLNSCSPFDLLGQLSELAQTDKIIFEWQEETMLNFASSKFYFCGKNKKITKTHDIKTKEERDRCLNKAKFLCSTTAFKEYILPADLYPITDENNFLNMLFKKLYSLYTLCFLLDQTNIENNRLIYKLNGFKSIAGELAFSQILDDETINIIYQIYEWGYQGGDIENKILIIRNILSLNLDPLSFNVNPNTFDAIISNYKIYQKDNVRQYLELRNSIIRDIRIYQEKVIHAIDNFEYSFKKISITMLSFFFLSVVLSILSFALSTNQYIPDSVILLCITICVISFLYYYKERKWLRDRIDHIEKNFQNDRKYFEDLLGEKELETFFEENGDSNKINIQYREKRIKEFSLAWIWTTIIILIFLIVIFILNHIHPLRDIIYVLKNICTNLHQSCATT